jgi:hypothetical protein
LCRVDDLIMLTLTLGQPKPKAFGSVSKTSQTHDSTHERS